MSNVAEFAASDVSGLSAEALASFKSTMEKYGFAAEGVETALKGKVESTPASENASSNAGPAFGNDPDSALSPAQRQEALDSLRQFWTGDPKELDAIQGQVKPAGDALNPTLYRLSYSKHAAAIPTGELAELDTSFRKAFTAASVPPSYGQSLVDALLSTMRMYEGTDESSAALKRSEQVSAINRLSNTSDIIKWASVAYQMLPADFREKYKNAFNSAQSYVSLASLGRALAYNPKD